MGQKALRPVTGMAIGPETGLGFPALQSSVASGVRADDVPASGGCDPQQDAGVQVVQGPAVALLGPVVAAAQQAQVAGAGRSAAGMGQGVVAVGAGGGLPAGREAAGAVPVVDQP